MKIKINSFKESLRMSVKKEQVIKAEKLSSEQLQRYGYDSNPTGGNYAQVQLTNDIVIDIISCEDEGPWGPCTDVCVFDDVDDPMYHKSSGMSLDEMNRMCSELDSCSDIAGIESVIRKYGFKGFGESKVAKESATSEELVGKQVKVVRGFFQGLEGEVIGINPSDNGLRIKDTYGDVSTISPENVEVVGD